MSTPGDPTSQNALVLRVVASHRTDPGWKENQQQLHERRMAQLRQDHADMITSFNASNRRHEMRMKSIQDASMQRWYQNQATSDATHRSFINYITDEHTVVDASGKAYPVDNSHQRYFVHKRDNTYIGTDSSTSLDDLRAKMRINPDDYKEVKIKK